MMIQDMTKTRLKEEVKTTHILIKENTELKRIKMETMYNRFVNL